MFQLLSHGRAEQLSAAVLRLPDTFEGLIATPDMFVLPCAQCRATPEEGADSATAAAKAAREPGAPDAIGPIDRMVADLLYKEPLQQVRLGDAWDVSNPKRQQWVPRFFA